MANNEIKSTCLICCDDKCNEFIECYHCHEACCYTCAETFILDKLAEPSCMHCRKPWTRDYILANFDRQFINKQFFPHIGKLVMEQEKNLLPETQPEVAAIIKINAIKGQVKELPSNAKLRAQLLKLGMSKTEI